MAPDCKSGRESVRWFESIPAHQSEFSSNFFKVLKIVRLGKRKNMNRFIGSYFLFSFIFVSGSNEMNLKVLKKGGFCDMIRIINKKIKMNKEIRSRIEWECNFVNKVPKIKERKLENCRTYKSCLCRTS